VRGARSVILEVGPVWTGLVVGGRVGPSIAAWLGTMRVTEQIDALDTLALSPILYLDVPRVMAATLMVPVVTSFDDALALFGGLLAELDEGATLGEVAQGDLGHGRATRPGRAEFVVGVSPIEWRAVRARNEPVRAADRGGSPVAGPQTGDSARAG